MGKYLIAIVVVLTFNGCIVGDAIALLFELQGQF